MAKAAKTTKPAPEVGASSKDELTQLEYAKIHIAANMEGSAHLSASQIADKAHAIAIAVLTKPAEPAKEEETEE